MTETKPLTYVCNQCKEYGLKMPVCENCVASLKAQVSSLTKERDELADRVRNLKETAAVAVKDNRSLRSQLSNREKEIEELKGKLEYHKEIVASYERAQKERHKAVELCFPPNSKGEAQ